jgi:CubicO group peptidase (beta-lactamase class C family)
MARSSLLIASLLVIGAGSHAAAQDPTNPLLRLAPQAERVLTSTLEVREFSGEFERWGDEVTSAAPKVETFRWRTSEGGVGSAGWKVLDGPPGSRAAVVASGSAGSAPPLGKVTAFTIDFAAILDTSFPAGRTYWVTLEAVGRVGQVRSVSAPVRINFVSTNDLTVFTPRGVAEPITSMLESVRQEYDLPALGAAIVTPAGIEVLDVVGIRQQGRSTPVTEQDLWHLGSDTKALTATLAAILIDKAVLRWSTTLGDVFPEYTGSSGVDPSYASLTILDLLRQRTGQRGNYEARDLQYLTLEGLTNTERRYLYVGYRLTRAPVLPLEFSYSNHNYVIAGAMLEKVTGRSWEEMMRTELFDPLGMKTAGFGPPGVWKIGTAFGEPDQPRGHEGYGADRQVSFADNPPASGPAGNVHASLRDWAKFIRLHLNGSEGDLQLSPSSVAMLLTPVEGYAGGWGSDGTTLSHDGSNNLWYARAVVYFADQFGVVIVTNVGGDPAGKAMGAMEAKLRDYYLN